MFVSAPAPWPDLINAGFEAFCAVGCWMNVFRLQRDRSVKGIVWQLTIGYWLWGVWNMVYYGPVLDQWASWTAGLFVVTGNFVWLVLWLKILWEEKKYVRVRYRRPA